MKPRILILPIAALVIAGLVFWRYGWESPPQEQSALVGEVRVLAPRFELYDQHSQLVKFERYLGRTALLILFFDADSAPDENVPLSLLRDHYNALNDAGIDVVAVSPATPFAVREAERRTGRKYPFPVLTDIDQRSPVPVPVHRLWGLADDDSPAIRTGMFFVERDGSVATDNGRPRPLEKPEAFVDKLVMRSP